MARPQPSSVVDIRNQLAGNSLPIISLGPVWSLPEPSLDFTGFEDCNNSNDFLKDSDPAVDYQTRTAKSPGTSGITV